MRRDWRDWVQAVFPIANGIIAHCNHCDIKSFRQEEVEIWEKVWVRMRMMVSMDEELDITHFIHHFYYGLRNLSKSEVDEKCGGSFLDLSEAECYKYFWKNI